MLLFLVQFVVCNTVQDLTALSQSNLHGFMITVVMEQNVSEYFGFTVSDSNPLCSKVLFRYGKLFDVI